jgi:hypothetical protein
VTAVEPDRTAAVTFTATLTDSICSQRLLGLTLAH